MSTKRLVRQSVRACACRLWNLVRFECVCVLRDAHADVVRCLSFATDAGAGAALLGVARAPADASCVRLLSGSYDGSLRVWRMSVPLAPAAAAAAAASSCAQQTSALDVRIEQCAALRVCVRRSPFAFAFTFAQRSNISFSKYEYTHCFYSF